MDASEISRQGLTPWLVLHLLPGLGPRRTQNILEQQLDLQRFIDGEEPAIESKLPQSTVAALQSWRVARGDFWEYYQQQSEQLCCWLESPGRAVLSLADQRYPALLREISDPPLLLYVEGSVDALADIQIAVVGSRRPTHQGAEIALEFGYQLTISGMTITSGLALGIDGQAHLGALRAQGSTVAVMGCGLGQIYPRQHAGLAADIIETGGALVSEFPLEMPPRANNFPRRNRIISGLSTGTLVVEAEMRSGSLVTARLAMEQGREVFAMPGSIRSPLSKGCHHLINEGALLVDGIEPILEVLSPQFLSPAIEAMQSKGKKAFSGSKFQHHLLGLMGNEICCIDILVIRSGKLVNELLGELQQLELAGAVRRVPGGYESCY